MAFITTVIIIVMIIIILIALGQELISDQSDVSQAPMGHSPKVV